MQSVGKMCVFLEYRLELLGGWYIEGQGVKELYGNTVRERR